MYLMTVALLIKMRLCDVLVLSMVLKSVRLHVTTMLQCSPLRDVTKVWVNGLVPTTSIYPTP